MYTLEKGNENDQGSSNDMEIEMPLCNLQLQHLLLEKWKEVLIQRAKVKVQRIPKTP